MIVKSLRGGMTLAETAIATAIVGTMLAAALNMVVFGVTHSAAVRDQTQAALLCEQLLTEILDQKYVSNGPPFSSTHRLDFDELMDYDGWSATPPRSRDGTALYGFETWQRQVTVDYVHPWFLNETYTSDTGMCAITVSVFDQHGKILAEVTGYRGQGWEEARAD